MDQTYHGHHFAGRVDGLAGETTSVWDIHMRAVADQAAGRDVIVMSVGDPDFATPAPIVDAAVAALQAGDTHYTAIIGRDRLRGAIAEEFSAKSGRAVGPENVVVTAGAQNALFSASLCLLSPGDEVLVFDPMYVTYEATLKVSGATIVRVPSDPATGFRPDIAALEAAVTERTRAIFFANPNNPTGIVFSPEEIAGIARIATENDLWVVSDEVYAGLTYDADHCHIGALEGMEQRSVTVSSVSKSHAMTGWRCGWLIAPEELVGHVHNLALCMNYGLPGFIQEAGAAAMTEALGEAVRMREIYRRRRDIVVEELAKSDRIDVVVPEAGMFLIADIRKTGLDAPTFVAELYREKAVSVLDATAFGASLAGFVRISFAASEAELTEASRRIVAFADARGGA